jgi:hypothetical protein
VSSLVVSIAVESKAPLDDAIYKLKGAGHTTTNLGKGEVIYDDQTVLHGPLGLIFAPNGDLITANADPTHFPPVPPIRAKL